MGRGLLESIKTHHQTVPYPGIVGVPGPHPRPGNKITWKSDMSNATTVRHLHLLVRPPLSRQTILATPLPYLLQNKSGRDMMLSGHCKCGVLCLRLQYHYNNDKELYYHILVYMISAATGLMDNTFCKKPLGDLKMCSTYGGFPLQPPQGELPLDPKGGIATPPYLQEFSFF